MTEELKKLKELDFSKQAAFAYLTCERLFPNYVYFSNNFQFGNPDVLRKSIDFLYHHIFKKNPSRTQIETHIKEVEKNTPDTEDFSTIFVSSALDACTCILDSLDFLMDKDFSRITTISSYAMESVDMYIRTLDNIQAEDKDRLKKVNDHPLMNREISIQQGIINFLHNSRSLDLGDLQTLLLLQDNNKKSNLGL